MVQLILLDGSLELGEKQKQILVKTPYFEALFVRWSEAEQTEYEVGLTVNTVKFLLGEVTQLNVLTQAAKQAVNEARRELDMVGATINSIDLESPVYPLNLHPLLEPYTIRKNSLISPLPLEPTLETYQLMSEWDPDMFQPQELNQLVTQVEAAIFPMFLRLFWQKRPVEFFSIGFSQSVVEQILHHPEIFSEHSSSLRSKLIELIMSMSNASPLFSFYQAALKLDTAEWIEQKLNGQYSHATLMQIIRQDRSYFFRCLNASACNDTHSWIQFEELLSLCNGAKECPLTEDEINHLKSTTAIGSEKFLKWSKKQIYISPGPEKYQKRFIDQFEKTNYDDCSQLLNVFPDHPFAVHINSGQKVHRVLNWMTTYPRLIISVDENIYRRHVFTLDQLKFLLPYTSNPRFGMNQAYCDKEEIKLLCHHQVYLQPDNVFLGSPLIATRMFELTLTAGLEPSPAYFSYFIEQKMWQLLPLLESSYKKHPNRLRILQTILTSDSSDIAKTFLVWETSLR